MKKIIICLVMVTIAFGCKENKEEPKPIDPELVDVSRAEGQWSLIKTQRRILDTLNQQVSFEENKYAPKTRFLFFAYHQDYGEVHDSTIVAYGEYRFLPSLINRRIEIKATSTPNAWTHTGMYHVDSLTVKRLVMRDTLKLQDRIFINTTTAIR